MAVQEILSERKGIVLCDLVVEVARTRQVFLCTCHEAWAAELETQGARLVRL